MSIRKHSARAVKYVNTTGGVEMFLQIGGNWIFFGWDHGVGTPFHTHKDCFSVKELLDGQLGKFTDSSLEYFSGKSIKQLLSKSFIYEWTTDQAVYGVPF